MESTGTTDDARTVTEIVTETFSVWRDDSGPKNGMDRIFALLDGPGPGTPYGTLGFAQAAVDAAVAAGDLDDLENGDGLESAGSVTYERGSTDNDALRTASVSGVTLDRRGDGE